MPDATSTPMRAHVPNRLAPRSSASVRRPASPDAAARSAAAPAPVDRAAPCRRAARDRARRGAAGTASGTSGHSRVDGSDAAIHSVAIRPSRSGVRRRRAAARRECPPPTARAHLVRASVGRTRRPATTAPGTRATSAASRIGLDRRAGSPGQKTKPTASTPSSTAASTSSSPRHAAELDAGHDGVTAVRWSRRPACQQAPQRLAGIGRRHEALADEKRAVAQSRAAAEDRRAVLSPLSLTAITPGRQPRCAIVSDARGVDLERAQVAVVDADDVGAGRQRARRARPRRALRPAPRARAARGRALQTARASRSSSAATISSTASAPLARASSS